MKNSLYSLLEDWLHVWVCASLCFVMGAFFGVRAIIAWHHNLRLNDVITWYGRGNGNIQQYYLSTLIVYSILWIAGGLTCLIAGWVYNRKRSGIP